MNQNKSPLIGITMDWAEEGTFSSYPHHALRGHYFDAITAAGGTPIALPAQMEKIDTYLDLVDGLLLPGGDGMDPAWYIDGTLKLIPTTGQLEFLKAMAKRAIERDVPILGICAGMQIMAGVMGAKICTLDESKRPFHIKTKTDYAHSIDVAEGSALHQAVGEKSIRINSAHVEEVVQLPLGVCPVAMSADGVTEAIEIEGKFFMLGVQWHPEHIFETDVPSAQIFKAFIKKADEYKTLHKK